MQDHFRLCPLLLISALLPNIQLGDNPVYDVLFLAGLEEVGTTLFIQARQNLFESVDGVVLDVVPQCLIGCRQLRRKTGKQPNGPHNQTKRDR